MLVTQVHQNVLQGRELFYDLDDQGLHVIKATCKTAAREYEARIRHPLFPDNAYFTEVPDFDVFQGTPTCELHFQTSGVYEHIVRAILHQYQKVLRRPDLVKGHDRRPLVSEARIGMIARRIMDRIRSLKQDETMLCAPPSFVETWSKVFVSQEGDSKMTGDQYKLTMLQLGFIMRDLIAPEVQFTLEAHTHTHI